MAGQSSISQIVREQGESILQEWMEEQTRGGSVRTDLLSTAELRDQSRAFLQRFGEAVQSGGTDTGGPGWQGARELLAELSRDRALKGFSPSETATFVFSLKRPLFARLRAALRDDPERLADETWAATELLDRLGLYTTESYQAAREQVIERQQQELMELSTPVVKIWTGVVAVPLIGTLDSARTQVVMETLLQEIVSSGASMAIIDITGVPTVDTLVAQHLIKTVAAARLMGADCIISGIRPQIAQTIVHLGISLENIATKASLADAIALALKQTGYVISRAAPRS